MTEVVTTHYDVLGVPEDATIDEIKRAYYARARLYHPDAHVGSARPVQGEAELAMQELNAAWHVLQDPKTRHRYDRLLGESSDPRRRGGAGRRPHRPLPALEIGSGFQSWLGGMSIKRGRGRAALNLRVAGATSLEPLRHLAPDGLWGLHAEDSRVDDAELRNLQVLTGLRYLDLSGTPVTDAGLVHVLACRSLDTLMLWETAVTDAGMELIGRMTSLRNLGVGNTRVTDAGLRHLRGLLGLRSIQLWGTDVTGPGLDVLHDLPELETITLPWRVRGRHRRRLRTARPGALVA